MLLVVKLLVKLYGLKKLISSFQIVKSISRSLVIYYDNTIVLHFSKNNRSFYLLGRKFQIFKLRLSILLQKKMLANPLTKDWTIGVFQNHVIHIGLVKYIYVMGQ